MRRLQLLFFPIFVFCLGSIPVPAQKPPPPPPPVARPTPPDVSDKTDEQFEKEVLASVKKPIQWKIRSLQGFSITIEMPRDPIRRTETFYEAGMGRMQAVFHLSMSDNAAYIVGRFSLPYSVKDEKVLRRLYREFASGLAEEGQTEFQHVKDLSYDGNLGVEMRSLPEDIRFQPNRSRAFVLGRDVYIMLAMPSENEFEHEPPDKEVVDSRTSDFDRFFDSVKIVKSTAKPPSTEPPLFANTWEDGEYSSKHFNFLFSPPSGWLKISQDDVDGVRSWGRSVISEEGGRTLPAESIRRNLVTFLSGPLGEEGLAMISFNLGVPSRSMEDAKALGAETERLLKGFPNFTVIKRPFQTRVGSFDAIGMENVLMVAGVKQQQHIFYFQRADFVLGLTITCVEKPDCVAAIASLSTLRPK